MQRQSEKGMVTMMSKTERAVRMKAVMPGSLSSAATKVKRGGNQLKATRRMNRNRVGRSVGRRGEQCNVREIRIDVIAVAVRVDSLLVPPKRAAVEGVTGWGCQRQAERGVQK